MNLGLPEVRAQPPHRLALLRMTSRLPPFWPTVEDNRSPVAVSCHFAAALRAIVKVLNRLASPSWMARCNRRSHHTVEIASRLGLLPAQRELRAALEFVHSLLLVLLF
eukprot:GHVR01153123.1.p2 GENE.GHVR01153123.1~~GHVR01153123.1.p2  ORF type:complete len:108 (+),score=11.16 GHVR01153123.1:158-481(+)